MKCVAVLNKQGGTLRTTDLNAYRAHLHAGFEAHGHALDIRTVSGKAMIDALEKAAKNHDCDAIIVAGGDGSVSAAAALCVAHKKALGIIPAGTMNLFARTLGIPLDIWEAADALAAGEVVKCDVGSANDRIFVHQFSVGIQPRVVLEREKYEYRSRIGKILANLRASFSLVAKPPHFAARGKIGRKILFEGELSALAVSNNEYGPGHLPYADKWDAGQLGVYWAAALDSGRVTRLVADLALGNWSASEDFKTSTATKLIVEFPQLKKSAKASIDGEIIPLEARVELAIHKKALKVLKPHPSASA